MKWTLDQSIRSNRRLSRELLIISGFFCQLKMGLFGCIIPSRNLDSHSKKDSWIEEGPFSGFNVSTDSLISSSDLTHRVYGLIISKNELIFEYFLWACTCIFRYWWIKKVHVNQRLNVLYLEFTLRIFSNTFLYKTVINSI